MLTAIVFTTVFFIACILSVARDPVYGVLAYVGVFYVNPPVRWWGQGILADVRWSLIAATVALIGIWVHRTSRSEESGIRSLALVFACFLVWLCVQLAWVIDVNQQQLLIEYYLKFFLAAYIIHRALDSDRSVRLFLWAHVLGCFYFGWLVYQNYDGGRFEEFNGAGVKDANEAALTICTAALILGGLVLFERLRARVVLVVIAPFLVNAIVATVSRSGFLAMSLGGIIFNFLAPRRYRAFVIGMSVLAVALLLMLTTETYWNRIETIKEKGAEVEGVDTGSGRLDIMKAQFQMFRDHPMGCGHQCTTTLSPIYLDADHLDPEAGVRASHNTVLSMLVDHGIPGVIMYAFLLITVAKKSWELARASFGSGTFVSFMLPGVAGSLAAMFLADQFVPYVRFEVRFWFVTLLFVLWRIQVAHANASVAPLTETVRTKAGSRSTTT